MLKEEVLSMLLNAQEPVSGEGICKTLGVTRAAVWKTIDQLRQEGYGIDAAPKRGYTLASVPDRLDTALVRAHLSGHPWQTLVTAVPSVDSTNNACKRLAAEGAPDGTAILTGCQTAGRGRRGRTFVSPPGGLYFSVILRPHAKPEALMHLTAMAAVAAARAVFAVSGVYPDIKWTNDLVLGGKKLCGILTEIGIEAESREVDYAVVGIGINCARVDLPPEVSAMSASLEAFTGQKPDRARLAAALVRSLCELEQALFTEKRRLAAGICRPLHHHRTGRQARPGRRRDPTPTPTASTKRRPFSFPTPTGQSRRRLRRSLRARYVRVCVASVDKGHTVFHGAKRRLASLSSLAGDSPPASSAWPAAVYPP